MRRVTVHTRRQYVSLLLPQFSTDHLLVNSLDLTDAEREAVLAVKADSLEAFAGALYQWSVEPGLMQGCSVA